MSNVEFWDKAHKESNIRWLTGSLLSTLEERFDIKISGTVLDIGIGTGLESMQMIQKGCIVDGLDISEEAFKKGIQFRRTFIFGKDSIPSNTYDYVICHLVAQHSNDIEFEELIKIAIKSLNEDGILVLQYYENNVNQRNIEAEEFGGVDRTLKYMVSLVETYGKVIWYKYVPEYKWGLMKIMNNACEKKYVLDNYNNQVNA